MFVILEDSSLVPMKQRGFESEGILQDLMRARCLYLIRGRYDDAASLSSHPVRLYGEDLGARKCYFLKKG